MDEGNIKRGFNVYLYYLVFPALLVFFLINYYNVTFKIETLDINLMISVVTFLFGFLISISFGMILSRVGALKESLAGETGRLVSLYLLSENLGSKFREKIAARIDAYTINTLRDYTNYNVGREAVYGMYDDIKYMEIKGEAQEASANSFLYIIGEFEPLRERLEYLTSGKLLWATKLANYILAFLLIGLLFLNRGDTFTNALFIILSTTIVFILLIIEDYEDLRIGDYIVNISNSEQLFDLIGRDRYYPQAILSRVKLEKGRIYRIGFYDKKAKQEKIVDIKYSPNFNSKINFLRRKMGYGKD